MTTTENNGNSDSLSVKILAIIGFSTIILCIGWLIIVVAKNAPSLFSSMADTAEDIGDYRPIESFAVDADVLVVDSGDTFTLTWSNTERTGVTLLSYPCTDSNAAVHMASDATGRAIRCGEALRLPEGTHKVELVATLEDVDFVDVPFMITFIDEDTEERVRAQTTVTVLRKDADGLVQGAQTDNDNDTVAEIVTPYTDIAVTIMGNTALDEQGIVSLDIVNRGTQTSASWTFTVTLPNGDTYRSPTQSALLPNEHAVLTIGYHAERVTNRTVVATVTTSRDNNRSNNTDSLSVR